jgi:hypothetical protein
MYKTKSQQYKAMNAVVMTKGDLITKVMMRGIK